MLIILPNKTSNLSARLLSLILKAKIAKGTCHGHEPEEDTVFNWGCKHYPSWTKNSYFLNLPHSVCKATNRIKAFEIAKKCGFYIPDYTTDKKEMKEMHKDSMVIGYRKEFTVGGKGMEIINFGNIDEDFVLYTEFIPYQEDIRLHVWDNEVFYVEHRTLRPEKDFKDLGTDNIVIRTRKTWKFEAYGCNHSKKLGEIAKRFFDEADLVFGAFDFVLARHTGEYVFLGYHANPVLTTAEIIKAYAKQLQYYSTM